MNLFSLTIQEAVKGLKEKQFSSVDLVTSCLERINQEEKKLNAFITVAEEGALKQAKNCDIQLASSGPQIFEQKPLLGIPAAIKDLYNTKGLRTTAGSKIINSYVPPYDATVVTKLKTAGVVIVGKTNQDAWGHGSSGENSDHGVTRNPYDFTRVPGGSSSGSAASLASGGCLFSTGTDTGSSVRLPAAYCNLVGIKPTYGRVSRYGIIAMASSFDTIGHLTKNVYDNAKILEITAGKDDLDATSATEKVPKYTQVLGQSIKGLSVGVPKEYFVEGMDNKVKESVLEAVKTIEKLGAKVKQISLPSSAFAMSCYYILVPSEISSNLSRFDGIRFGQERETFGDEAKRRIILGTYTLSAGYFDAYYLRAAKVRSLVKKDFDQAFKNVDVIIVPSSPSLPFKIGEKSDDPVQMYLSDIFLCPINIAGIPSLNVPCGFAGGLPVGMQIVGPQFSEELLFKVGYAYEQVTDWNKRTPKI
ncbi:MAG: Asp-tRNA(Asn)/Glu-tRNA(Gln) amidotransferase subunit GatA [Patescibacteria group bacterium]|nr:Asp-tRNA(Asn)/Glu-tRNA(Gln) amidotransferase subunit GatA [Patescibacteria group bacterium]